MLPFALTIFTGAFLLFLVQPLIAKFILPWFGGGPAVWTTCLLFFQAVLLAGYAYAHWSISRLTPRKQALVHLVALLAALVLLPIAPGTQWKPMDGSEPTLRILLVLCATIGLPYLVLSATGPLLQAWFSRARPRQSPYRLYALSNIGSLLALVSYPFLVEPNLSRHAQATAWSIGLGVFVLLCGWCAFKIWQSAAAAPVEVAPASPAPAAPKTIPQGKSPKKSKQVQMPDAADSPRAQLCRRALWFLLPACASVLLLAVTNKICQDVAVVPFLWVLPLSVYLVSFIISFDNPRWYRRGVWLMTLGLAFAVMLWMTLGPEYAKQPTGFMPALKHLLKLLVTPMPVVVGVYLTILFVSCMVCHGELYRLKPAAGRLTGFYLMISAGGAFGGLCVALLAPLCFNRFVELQLGLFLVCLLVLWVLYLDRQGVPDRARPAWVWVLLWLSTGSIGLGLYQDANQDLGGTREFRRNFYGVLRVVDHDADNPEDRVVVLKHGSTTHGSQFQLPARRLQPTTYYTQESGVGLAMRHFPRQTGRRIGLVGLGTGTLATYGRPGDYMRIYEIDPAVVQLARSHFTFLKDCQARIEMIPGDARLSMERDEPQQFDILVLDAFSGDSIPVHLLTREAFEIYRRHLKPDGVIAIHISNRYLDLSPVVLLLAGHFHFDSAFIFHSADNMGWQDVTRAYTSRWMLLSNNRDFLQLKPIRDASSPVEEDIHRIKLWTDEESNLFKLLKF